MVNGKAELLLAFLNCKKEVLEQKKFLNESLEEDSSKRVLSDEEYFEKNNPRSGSEILRFIKNKLG